MIYELASLLDEGRVLETILKTEQGVAVPRLRLVTAGLLGRPGTPPAGHYDPAARSIAARTAEEMLQTEARPPAKNRHGGAPRGARPSAEGRKALRFSAWPAA